MLRYIFLVMEEHPYGRQMFDHLRRVDLLPQCIIMERSSVATEEQRKFEERMAGFAQPPFFESMAGSSKIYHVNSHNDIQCLDLVRRMCPEWIVLGGTRIIRGDLLGFNMLNVHPGLLPWVRGSSAEAWSILNDLPVGVTCHRVDSGVDTGPLLIRRYLEVLPQDSYERIVWQNTRLAAQTMVEALKIIQAGKANFIPQNLDEGREFTAMPNDMLDQVRQKLDKAAYLPVDLAL